MAEVLYLEHKMYGNPPRHYLVAWVFQAADGSYWACGLQADARTGNQEDGFVQYREHLVDAETDSRRWYRTKVYQLENAPLETLVSKPAEEEGDEPPKIWRIPT